MDNVYPLFCKPDCGSAVAMDGFVRWARVALHKIPNVINTITWDQVSWGKWGLLNTKVTKLEEPKCRMDSSFVDFAKSILVYRYTYYRQVQSSFIVSLRLIESALLDVVGVADIKKSNGAVFDRASYLAQLHWTKGDSAYQSGRILFWIYGFLKDNGMLDEPFVWNLPIKLRKRLTLVDAEEHARTKLPSDDALVALGEIFHNKPELGIDVMVSSAVAIMLSHPCRIGELSYLADDCLYYEKSDQGEEQLYIKWYASKGYGNKPVPVVDSMADICKEAVERVSKFTKEARAYAKWLEDNPEVFPPHPGVPDKGPDEPLTIEEVCNAMMVSTGGKTRTFRHVFKREFLSRYSRVKMNSASKGIVDEVKNGFDSVGERVYVNGVLDHYKHNDTFCLTLRKLNILLRDKYLPPSFPYTDNKKITKFKDALFCVRTGVLNLNDHIAATHPLGVTLGCERSRLISQISGSSRGVTTIFERHGYIGIVVKSHSFRHYLNTAAQRVGLSQVLVAAWSGRVDIGQNRVYNHISTEEKVSQVAIYAPSFDPMNISVIEKIDSTAEINIKDLGGAEDRIVRSGPFGLCIHDFAESPCSKLGACLKCSNLVCVKGDDVKLKNIKEERDRLHNDVGKVAEAIEQGLYGAERWLDKCNADLEHCNKLIGVLENPDLPRGSLLRNADNGWNATTNALYANGMLERKRTSRARIDKNMPNLLELECLAVKKESR